MDAETTSQTYDGRLLSYIGCTADAEVTAELFDDTLISPPPLARDLRTPCSAGRSARATLQAGGRGIELASVDLRGRTGLGHGYLGHLAVKSVER